MDATILQQVPEEYKQIYIRNWNTIKPSIRQGVIKDLYHYPLFSDSNDEIKSRLRETVVKYTRKIKLMWLLGLFYGTEELMNLDSFTLPTITWYLILPSCL